MEHGIHTLAGDAIECGDASGKDKVVEEWQDFATHATESATAKGIQRKKKRQLHRIKTHQWVYESDNAIFHATGAGWKQYQIGADWLAKNSLLWPLALINADNGPDGHAARCWMEGPGQINIDWLPDMNHGVWNTGWGAAVQSGLGPFLLCSCVVMNVWYAPWNDGRFGDALRCGFDEYANLLSWETCPLFPSFFFQAPPRVRSHARGWR